jgi:hypothetical protein
MLSSYPLVIVERTGHRYLVNISGRAVRRLVFCTGCRFIDWDGTVIDSPAPRYELRDLPASCHVRFEAIELDEGGTLWWQADEVLWEDGSCDRDVPLREQEHASEPNLPGREVDVPKVLLETSSGSVCP